MDALFSEMRGLERRRLNISVVSTANYFMPQLLAKFIQLHPKIQVNLHVANRGAVLKQLSENSADLAITGQSPEGTDMLSQSFMQNPLVVIAAPQHPLAKARNIKLNQLVQNILAARTRFRHTWRGGTLFRQPSHETAAPYGNGHQRSHQAIRAGWHGAGYYLKP